MARERSFLGDGSVGGAGNVTSEVSNNYGARVVGGANGELSGTDAYHESVINFDATGPLFDKQVIPAGAVVTEVLGVGLTGTISTAVVGALDISAANGAVANYKVVVAAGELAVTGPTAGSVLVRWLKVA